MSRPASGFAGWETSELVTESGLTVPAKMPLIVTASRATDIPAFYGQWFFERLEKGYVSWKNSYNRKTSYVSFAKTRLIVFWTKNPAPVIPLLHILDSKGIGCYFQYTLNDYEDENLEPGVPPLAARVASFRQLSEMIGRRKVIWRFDPLLLLPGLDLAGLLRKVEKIGNSLVTHTDRFVFSFADIAKYRKVRGSFAREGLSASGAGENGEFSAGQKIEFARGLAGILNRWRTVNSAMEAVTCGEDIDLSAYGIKQGSCVDFRLMSELFGNAPELMRFLGNDRGQPVERKEELKDRGQRKECGCVVSKDIGQYDTCGHGCVYCYANSSREIPMLNLMRHRNNSGLECIVP